MKNFYSWFRENVDNISISTKEFSQSIDKGIEKLVDYYYKKDEKLKTLKFDVNAVNNIIKDYPNRVNLLASVGRPDFRFQINRYYNWMKLNNLVVDANFRQVWNILQDQNDVITKSFNLQTNLNELVKLKTNILKQTEVNMEKVAQVIREAIGRIVHWGNSPIIIEATEHFSEYGNEIALEASYNAFVHVGPRATFSLFFADESIQKIAEVEDIIEGGDEDDYFFPNPNNKGDYYSLINELKNPGSTNKGKLLTLYTARPVKDREFYSNTKTLPINIFLTNSYSHADGLAHDLSSGEPRDIWQVKIDSKYLIQTLDGPIKYYMVAVDNAPVHKIVLY